MKITLNDQYGSRLICVTKLNGEPAVEKVDFIQWEGAYHRNGKWSYAEGGVALKNGVVCHLGKSTHRNFNNQLRFLIVKDDKEVYNTNLGQLINLDCYPKFPEEWREALEAAFELQLKESYSEAEIGEFRTKWELASKFY
jgi:hypothetical protein